MKSSKMFFSDLSGQFVSRPHLDWRPTVREALLKRKPQKWRVRTAHEAFSCNHTSAPITRTDDRKHRFSILQ